MSRETGRRPKCVKGRTSKRALPSSALLPKADLTDTPAMSLRCHKRTHALQQTASFSRSPRLRRASRAAGRSRPSILAVLRLTTSSYLVGACNASTSNSLE
jgi:hypothetical protein